MVTLIDATGQVMRAHRCSTLADDDHCHDQDRAIEPNLAMSTARVATNST